MTARCAERTFTFRTIDPPYGTPGVDMNVQALTITNWGTIVAQYQMPPDPDWFTNIHAAVLRRGAWTNVDPEGALSSAAVPNNRGQLLITYRADGPWHLAIRDRRGFRPLPDLAEYPGGILGNGFNDLEQITGVAIDAAGLWHGFLGSVERYEIVDHPDAMLTIPMWSNDLGVAVGYYFLADGSGHGFRYSHGRFTTVDRPGAGATFLVAINNLGVVAGNFMTASGEFSGFLLERGRFIDLRYPGVSFTQIYSVNDLGQVAGNYCDAAGACHGFVATPVHGE